MRNNFKFCSLGLVLLALSSNALGQSAARDYDLDSVQDSASVSTSGGNSVCQINSGASSGGVLAQLALPFPCESAPNAVWATDAGIPRATPDIGVAVSIREAGSTGTSHIFLSPAGLNLSGAMPLPPGAIIEDLAFISDQTGDGRPDLVVEYAALVGPNWVSVIDSARYVEVGRFIDVSLAAVIQAAQGGQIIALTGDLTGDGAVSQSDLMVLFEGIGEPYSIALDVNADGEVDALDIASLVEQLGQILSLGLSQSSPLQSSGSANNQSGSATPSSGSNSCAPCDNPPTESGASPPDPACDALGNMSLDCPGPVFPGQSYSVSVLAWLGGIDISDISICIELPDGSVQGSLTATGIAPSEPGEYPIFVRVRYGSCCRTLQCNLVVIDPQNPPFDPDTPPSCGPSGLSLQIVPPLGGRLGSGCPQVPPALASLTSIPSIGTNDIVQLAAKIMPSGTFASGYVRWQLSASSGGCVRGLSLRQSSVQEVFELQPGQLAAGCTITVRAIYVFDDMRCPPLSAECTFQVSADSDLDGLLDTYEDLLGCTIPLERDTDYDTYLDGEEVLQYGTNPCDLNSAPAGTRRNLLDDDNDGLSNYVERFLGMSLGFNRSEVSDPTLPDTDGDMMIDLAELWLGTDPSIANDWNPSVITLWQKIDADLDLLPDELELARGTDPLEPDSNGNKILDGVELIFGISDVDTSNVFVPTANDQDGDGIADSTEQSFNADPLKADTDGDGLSDWLESKLSTSAAEVDTDGDGILDEEEVRFGLDPTRSDTDRNGVRDGDEDYDGDGANNMNEAANGSNPRRVDTDGDGVSDGEELTDGSDPTNPSSLPDSQSQYARAYLFVDGVMPRPFVSSIRAVRLNRRNPQVTFQLQIGRAILRYTGPYRYSTVDIPCAADISLGCEGLSSVTDPYANRLIGLDPGRIARTVVVSSRVNPAVSTAESLAVSVKLFGAPTEHSRYVGHSCCNDCSAPVLGFIGEIRVGTAAYAHSSIPAFERKSFDVELSIDNLDYGSVCGQSHISDGRSSAFFGYATSASKSYVASLTSEDVSAGVSATATITAHNRMSPVYALQDWYRYQAGNPSEMGTFIDPDNPDGYLPEFIGQTVPEDKLTIDEVASDGSSIVFFRIPHIPGAAADCNVLVELNPVFPDSIDVCSHGSLRATPEEALNLAPHPASNCSDYRVLSAKRVGDIIFYIPPSEFASNRRFLLVDVKATCVSQGSGQSSPTVTIARIKVVPPPVLLVHGLFGSGEWMPGASGDAIYFNQGHIAQFARTPADIESWVLNYKQQHAGSFGDTYAFVPKGIDVIRRNWRRLDNDPVANSFCRQFATNERSFVHPGQVGLENRTPNRLVTRIDVIGHSMGGNITALYMSNIANDGTITINRRVLPSTLMRRRPDFNDPSGQRDPSGGTKYYRRSNMNEGDIRRFVSIGTPHYGSRLGNLVIAAMNPWQPSHVVPESNSSHFEDTLRRTDLISSITFSAFRSRLIEGDGKIESLRNGSLVYSGEYTVPYAFEDLAEPLHWEVTTLPVLNSGTTPGDDVPVLVNSILHRMRYRIDRFYPPGTNPPAEPPPSTSVISPRVSYPEEVLFFPIATLIENRTTTFDTALVGAEAGWLWSHDIIDILFPPELIEQQNIIGMSRDSFLELIGDFRDGITQGEGDGVVAVESQRLIRPSSSDSYVDSHSWGMVYDYYSDYPLNQTRNTQYDQVGHSQGVKPDSFQTHKLEVLSFAYHSLRLPKSANRHRSLNDP